VNFAPDLAQKILDGEKTVTRRMPSDNPRSPWWRERCAYEPDRNYAICPGRGKAAVGRLRIVGLVRMETLDGMLVADGEARREGFANNGEFIERWRQLHGIWEAAQLVWRVEFEVVPDG
jgi:hypothetical protein